MPGSRKRKAVSQTPEPLKESVSYESALAFVRDSSRLRVTRSTVGRARSLFQRLPPELKMEVLRKRDQKSISLVCREWKELIAPILFYILRIYSGRRSSIPSLKVHGILSHVRSIENSCLGGFDFDFKKTEDDLIQIMEKIPENRLVKFRSETYISFHLYCYLFQEHQCIEHLDAPVDPGSITFRREYGRDLNLHTMRNLKDLTILYSGSKYMSRTYDKVTNGLKQLQKLRLDGDVLGRPRVLMPFKPALFQLKVLCIEQLVLEDKYLLKGCIDPTSLIELSIINCIGVDNFLETLYKSESSNACLRVLTIIPNRDDYESRHTALNLAIERFLKSFSGLESIYLDGVYGAEVWTASLLCHKRTLRTLYVGPSSCLRSLDLERQGSKRRYTADQLDLIMSMTKLDQIALDLGCEAVRLPKEFFRPCDTSKPPVSFEFTTAFTKRLDILSRSSTLHTLRLLQEPTFSELPYQLRYEFYQWGCWTDYPKMLTNIKQHLATQIMQYLIDRGSNIKLIAILPYTKRPKFIDLPYVRHSRRVNSYIRGQRVDAEGKVQVAAIPTEFPLLDRPESDILRLGYQQFEYKYSLNSDSEDDESD